MLTQVDQSRRAAVYYRKRFGWNPLPSRSDIKAPIGDYAELWDTPVEPMALGRWPGPNVQLMTGVRWNLAVIDLDSEAAVDAWQSLTLHRENPRTWTILTGAENYHLYYRVPGPVKELRTRTVWDGGGKHEKVELIGDRHLIVAPPSRHVDTGRPYRFMIGPCEMAEPALMPLWMTRLADVRPRPDPKYFESLVAPEPVATGGRTYDRRDVLRAIRDKLGLAMSWGLRVVGRHPNADGWLACRSLLREDLNPSAGFNINSGYYSEPQPPSLRLSLFDVAVTLGVYPTWPDAVNGLGKRFGAMT